MYKIKNSIEFDDNKCIKCTKCVQKCSTCSIGFLKIEIDENNKKHLTTNKDRTCISCGQCTLVCPINAIKSQDSLEEFKESFKDKSKIFIAQAAPSVRASIGEGWKIESNINIEKKMNTAFRKLGFNKIFDVSFGADITTVVEAEELIERLENPNSILPMFTSCCPSWVEYVFNYHPELKNNLTTARSPHIHSAIAFKTWWAEKENIDPKNIVVVSIMPCTSKKEEILKKYSKINNEKSVDYVLTVREIIQLLKENNINLAELEESETDSLGEYSGGGIIYGANGGVMESALRTVYKILTNNDLENFNLTSVRANIEGLKTAEIDIKGKKIKVAVVSTVQNLNQILEELKQDPNKYHYIEVMSCLGGCINGGGQPLLPIKSNDQLELIKNRQKMLYSIDENKINKRASYQNIYVKEYMEWLKNKNDSEFLKNALHANFELELN